MKVFEQITNLLDENSIEYTLTKHEAVKTSIEAAAIRGVELKTGAKAMIMKAKDRFHLFVLPADKQIDWKKVKEVLGSKEVRFATVEEAEELANVKMGSVPPFGNILGVDSYLDKELLENEFINFNPGSLTHSIQMKAEDLLKVTSPTLASFIKQKY